MKKKIIIALILFLTIILIPLTNLKRSEENRNTMSYGVFTGLPSKDINKLLSYKEVVIDASFYSKSQIDFLHKHGIKVYSYLNIGSLETFRSYYSNFKNLTLDNYEHWSDEKWLDVSNPLWIDYAVNTLGSELKHKDIDGFFLDNLDVYSKYRNDNTFNGLISIIKGLNAKYSLPVIANGGFDFFKAVENKGISIKSLVCGITVESVYTSIDFNNNNKFTINSISNRDTYINYLKSLKARGIDIYIVEYSKDNSLNKAIESYYSNLGFKVYISSSINLN